jgi:hypothetical protein
MNKKCQLCIKKNDNSKECSMSECNIIKAKFTPNIKFPKWFKKN